MEMEDPREGLVTEKTLLDAIQESMKAMGSELYSQREDMNHHIKKIIEASGTRGGGYEGANNRKLLQGPSKFDKPTILRTAEDFLEEFRQYCVDMNAHRDLWLRIVKQYLNGKARRVYDAFIKRLPHGDFSTFEKEFKENLQELGIEERKKKYHLRKLLPDEDITEFLDEMKILLATSKMPLINKIELLICALPEPLQEQMLAQMPDTMEETCKLAHRLWIQDKHWKESSQVKAVKEQLSEIRQTQLEQFEAHIKAMGISGRDPSKSPNRSDNRDDNSKGYRNDARGESRDRNGRDNRRDFSNDRSYNQERPTRRDYPRNSDNYNRSDNQERSNKRENPRSGDNYTRPDSQDRRNFSQDRRDYSQDRRNFSQDRRNFSRERRENYNNKYDNREQSYPRDNRDWKSAPPVVDNRFRPTSPGRYLIIDTQTGYTRKWDGDGAVRTSRNQGQSPGQSQGQRPDNQGQRQNQNTQQRESIRQLELVDDTTITEGVTADRPPTPFPDSKN